MSCFECRPSSFSRCSRSEVTQLAVALTMALQSALVLRISDVGNIVSDEKRDECTSRRNKGQETIMKAKKYAWYECRGNPCALQVTVRLCLLALFTGEGATVHP